MFSSVGSAAGRTRNTAWTARCAADARGGRGGIPCREASRPAHFRQRQKQGRWAWPTSQHEQGRNSDGRVCGEVATDPDVHGFPLSQVTGVVCNYNTGTPGCKPHIITDGRGQERAISIQAIDNKGKIGCETGFPDRLPFSRQSYVNDDAPRPFPTGCRQARQSCATAGPTGATGPGAIVRPIPGRCWPDPRAAIAERSHAPVDRLPHRFRGLSLLTLLALGLAASAMRWPPTCSTSATGRWLASSRSTCSNATTARCCWWSAASKCGYTPQYEGLEALHSRRASRCSASVQRFQGPGARRREADPGLCTLTYGVRFPMFEKCMWSVSRPRRCTSG